MSVSKRNGSKYWYIQFQYNGKTYIKSSKTTDKQLALNIEAQWRKQLIEQSQLGLKSPIEITKGFQLFIKSKSHIKSIKYTVHWCEKASNHFKHVLYVHQITTIEIDRFRQQLQSNNYSNQTIKHVMNQVGVAFPRISRLAFPRISRQIMMSKLKRSHSNGTNQICRRVQVRGGQASHR
jgi:hypothetical protein